MTSRNRNHSFNAGDRIPRPQGQGGGGGGSGEGDGESTQDDFTFSLSREEFMNLFFDDLELPHLERNFVAEIRDFKLQRAGYTTASFAIAAGGQRSLVARQ